VRVKRNVVRLQLVGVFVSNEPSHDNYRILRKRPEIVVTAEVYEHHAFCFSQRATEIVVVGCFPPQHTQSMSISDFDLQVVDDGGEVGRFCQSRTPSICPFTTIQLKYTFVNMFCLNAYWKLSVCGNVRVVV